MKSLKLLLPLLVIFSFQLSAQEKNEDKKKGANLKLEINKGDIDDHDHDHDHHDHDHDYDEDHKVKRSKIRFGMLDLGISSYLAEDGGLNMPDEYSYMDQRLAKSINVGIQAINLKFGLAGKKNPQVVGLSTGVRFNMVHYSFEENFILDRDHDDFFAAINRDVEQMKNHRLYASYLAIPVMLELNTNPSKSSKSFNLAVGYVYNLLLGSNHRSKSEADTKLKIKDDYNLNKNIGMLEVRAGYGPVNFYFQYGLDNLFQADKGPELTPINFGINLLPR